MFDPSSVGRISLVTPAIYGPRHDPIIHHQTTTHQQTELEASCWSPLAVAEINAKLPEDIRLFSVAKVTKNFRPRDAVSFREYQYLLPVRLLRPVDEDGRERAEGPSDEELMARFCALLARYQGTHNFHNFTKIKVCFWGGAVVLFFFATSHPLTRVPIRRQSRDLIRRLKTKAGAARNVWQFNNPRGVEDEAEAAAAAAASAEDDEEEGEAEEGAAGGPPSSWEAPRIQGLGTAKVDGVRKFNTGVALNPLFEILRASPQGQRALNDKGPERGAGVEHVSVRGVWDVGWIAGWCAVVEYCLGVLLSTCSHCVRTDTLQIGDPADGLSTALWDLTRYQGTSVLVNQVSSPPPCLRRTLTDTQTTTKTKLQACSRWCAPTSTSARAARSTRTAAAAAAASVSPSWP